MSGFPALPILVGLAPQKLSSRECVHTVFVNGVGVYQHPSADHWQPEAGSWKAGRRKQEQGFTAGQGQHARRGERSMFGVSEICLV
jgi:hypothetical protein